MFKKTFALLLALCMVLSLLPATTLPAAADGTSYYLVGSMNGWAISSNYQLTQNASATGTEYSIDVELTTTSEFKIISSEDGGTPGTWYPDQAANYGANGEITGNGLYTVYFRPNGDGGNDWFYNVIYVARDLSGSGTESDPYLIYSARGWEIFAQRVNAGVDADKYWKLANSISGATATVGTEAHPFTGVFDGNNVANDTSGVVLNVDIYDNDTQGTAPFREIAGGAIIRNLVVTGLSKGTTHTAGLVGFSRGATEQAPNTIYNCTVNTEVRNENTSGNRHVGGVVGHAVTSYLKLEHVVCGSYVYFRGNYGGGLVGWGDGANITLNQCLFRGSYSSGNGYFCPYVVHNSGSTTTVTANEVYSTASSNIGATHANCAYYGTRVYTSTQSGLNVVTPLFDGNTYYINGTTAVNFENIYVYTGSEITVTPVVKFNDEVLTEGTDYTVAISPSPIQNKGKYTLTVTGTGAYAGSSNYSFYVIDQLSGSGTSSDPYLINSAADWATFAENVALGANRNSYYKLTADISVSTMVGNSSYNFSGSFDGDGHTLTVNYTADYENVGPFRYVSDASINNLHVAGTITTSAKMAGGLVGDAYGNTRITNCSSSVTIISSVSGDGTHGGFVARYNASGSLHFNDCLFDGKLLTTSDTTHCGGFVGWPESGTMYFSNCLYAPAALSAGETEVGGTGSGTFTRVKENGRSPVFSADTYYVRALGAEQGTQIYAVNPADVFCSPITALDGNVYYAPATAALTESIFRYEANVIHHPTPVVTASDGTVLTEGTDYTVTYSAQDDSAVGSYTLTVTDTAGATQTLSYCVDECPEGLAFDSDAAGTYAYRYINFPNESPYTRYIDLTNVADGFTFAVYDNGGKTGKYTNNYDGELVFTALPGWYFTVTGIATTEGGYDYLKIGTEKFGSNSGQSVSVTTQGHQLSMLFHSDGSSMYDGLVLQVTVLHDTDLYTLTAGTAEHGTIALSAPTAQAGTEISMTATPETGYYLAGVTLTGENYSETVYGHTFCMPHCNATVTPIFEEIELVDGHQLYKYYDTASGAVGVNNGESPAKLVDNDKNTKYCVGGIGATDLPDKVWVEFRASEAFVPMGYVLTTGGDTASNSDRNPKSWKLYGKLNNNDGWTLITEVTNDAILQAQNTADFSFALDEAEYGYYQYFRFEVHAIRGGSVFQLAELQFYGESSYVRHQEATAPTCTQVGYYECWEDLVTGEYYLDENCTQPVAAAQAVRPTVPHTLEHLAATAPTASPITYGNLECWRCTVCGAYFIDAAGQNEIDEEDITVYPAVPYLDETGTVAYTSGAITRITAETTVLTEGWYLADGTVTVSDRMTVIGHAKLLLADGAALTAAKGISVTAATEPDSSVVTPNMLTIYSQSLGDNMGALTVTAPDSYYAGIGGYGTSSSKPGHSGDIVIAGGRLNVNGGANAAGIGGGAYGGGKVTVYNGNLTVKSGSSAAGIGSGYENYTKANLITIYGGTVSITVTNGYGAGIGGGEYSSGGTITIYGGNVTAYGGSHSAGIGGCDGYDGGTITIYGGTVTAKPSGKSAAIGGGGYWSSSINGGRGGNIYIYGGTITALTQNANQNGIGDSVDHKSSGSCQIVIDASLGTSPLELTSPSYATDANGLQIVGNLMIKDSDPVEFVTENTIAGKTVVPFTGSTVELSFYVDGSLYETQTVAAGGFAITPNVPMKVGYVLRAWQIGGVDVDFTTQTFSANTTLTATWTAAPAISYLDADGAERSTTAYITLKNDLSGETTLAAGWYAVTASIKIARRLQLDGDVHLILCNGVTLTANYGIAVEENDSLTVYGQTTVENTMGALTVSTVENNSAAIGGNNGQASGVITINGGKLNVKGGLYGAGIGGSYEGAQIGAITINGGCVTARAGSYASGIGAGYYGGDATVTINGGTISAYGASHSAGIGGASYSGATNVTVTGGTVYASGDFDGAGIGGGSDTDDPVTVTITGGTLTCIGGGDGAGIGGGYRNTGTLTITISGGSISANGGNYAAGIGGGGNYSSTNPAGSGGTIRITGGVIEAVAGKLAAAIGGGGNEDGNGVGGVGGSITISGGQVTCTASAENSFGIGNGYKQTGECTISLGWTALTDFISSPSYAGTVTLAKTFFLDGTMTPATTENIAGSKIIPLQSDATLVYDQVGFSVEGVIKAQFAIFNWNHSTWDYDSYYMIVTHHLADGTEKLSAQIPLEANNLGGSYIAYVGYYDVVATYMADQLDVKVYAVKNGATFEGPVSTTSVRAIAAAALTDASNTAAKKKVYADMLAYGAQAQQRFGYNTGDLANALTDTALTAYNSNVTAADPAYQTLSSTVSTPAGMGTEKVTVFRTALSVEERVYMQFGLYYGNNDAANFTIDLKIGTRSVTVTAADLVAIDAVNYPGYYVLIVDSIDAVEGQTPVSVTVYEGQTPVSKTYTNTIENLVAGKSGDDFALGSRLVRFYRAINALLNP